MNSCKGESFNMKKFIGALSLCLFSLIFAADITLLPEHQKKVDALLKQDPINYSKQQKFFAKQDFHVHFIFIIVLNPSMQISFVSEYTLYKPHRLFL